MVWWSYSGVIFSTDLTHGLRTMGEKMTQYGRTKHCWDKRTQCFLREERSRCVICAEFTSRPRWFRMCCSQHFMKLLIFLLRQQLTKLSGLSREFGEFLPPIIPLLLWTVVGVAAMTYDSSSEVLLPWMTMTSSCGLNPQHLQLWLTSWFKPKLKTHHHGFESQRKHARRGKGVCGQKYPSGKNNVFEKNVRDCSSVGLFWEDKRCRCLFGFLCPFWLENDPIYLTSKAFSRTLIISK